MNTEVDMLVERAAGVFVELPRQGDDAILLRLRELSGSEDRAERLLTFLPLAFGRVLLMDLRPKLSATYRLGEQRAAGTSWTEVALSEEPEFVAAESLARRWLQSGLGERVEVVGCRSAEFNAAKRVREQGSDLSQIYFSAPAIIPRSAAWRAPPESREATRTDRKWWQFWR